MNNYHIYEEVGRGKCGASVVYKGRKKKSIEYVAVKSVERGRRKKLMDEVAVFQMIQNDHLRHHQASPHAIDGAPSMGGGTNDASGSGTNSQGGISGAASLNWHPNILKFYNWYETRNHFWIIFEYCVGGDLQGLLEQDKKLPEHTVKKFAYEMLEGFSYLHSQGIIYGDLKPSNVLMNEYCKLKLCDFGLAKKVTDLSNLGMKNSAEERASSHSQANQGPKNKAGTPYYMAPELFQDSGVYSYQSDFWSLGCILIELATGRPPFYANSLKDLVQQIAVQEVPIVKGFSAEFNDLVQKILQKDPVNRIWWDELKKHPWWTTPLVSADEAKQPQSSAGSATEGPYKFDNLKKQTYSFTKRIYQPQLQFDRYLQTVRKIDPQAYHQMRQRGGLQKIGSQMSETKSESKTLSTQPSARTLLGTDYQPHQASTGTLESSLQQAQPQALNPHAQQQEDENDAYNNHIQSRTKSMRNQSKIKADESYQKAEEARTLDFYGKAAGGEYPSTTTKDPQGTAAPALAKPNPVSKTPPLERSDRKAAPNSGHGQPYEEQKRQHTQTAMNKKASSPMNSGQRAQESRVPSNPATGRQTANPSQAAKNPNVVKQNNFFTPTQPTGINTQQAQIQKRTTSPKPPQNPNTGAGNLGQNYQHQGSNFKNQTQQIFKNKTLGGIGTDFGAKGPSDATSLGQGFGTSNPSLGMSERKGSDTGRAEGKTFEAGAAGISGRKEPQRPDAEASQQPSKQPLIMQSKNIDRLQFLNDQFDQFEDLEEGYEEMDYSLEKAAGGDSSEAKQAQGKPPEQQWEYHQPMDAEQAFTTLRLMKDLTLFNSTLSQAQIKAETQTLVTQTVQIGPVQNQGASNQAGSQGGISGVNSTFSNNNSMGRIQPSDATSLQTAKAATISMKEQSSASNPGALGTGAGAQPTQMKVPHKTIEQLIIHNSDTAVKPIVGNKEIERIHDPPLNTQHLQFTPWTSDEVIEKINTAEIESHLSDVYTSIASNTTINEKISTLQYFESIIVNSNVSNSLINSAFMALLKKMLEQIKSPMIKIRVCSVVGLLIRHSTIIDNELAEIDIASQLIDTLRDSNEKVRRRAIAALGEYMFYAATQLDDEMADPVWELSDDAIDIIVQSLDEREPDNIVRFYACKTLENICAQSTSAGHRFATPSTVQHVLNIFLMEKEEQQLGLGRPGTGLGGLGGQGDDQDHDQPQDQQQQSYLQWYEGIKISAAIALSHICKLNPQLFPVIFETITPSSFCETLLHGNGQYRVQQAFITMLNLALHNIYYPQISSVLLQEPAFFQALQKLLDHQHIVIRGKCILTFLLLFKLDFRWMTAVQQEIKFFTELDKLLKDNYKYVQCCLLCLAEGVQDIIPTIFKTVCEQLVICVDNSKLAPANKHKNATGQQVPSLLDVEEDETNLEFIRKRDMTDYGDFSELARTQLYHITILLHLQINPLIRSRLLSTPTVQAIATMLDVCDVKSFRGAPQFLNALLIFAENLSLNSVILQILAQPILSLLVPVLFHKLRSSQSLDIKSLTLKIYTDMMTQYLGSDAMFKTNKISQYPRADSPTKGPDLDNATQKDYGMNQQSTTTTKQICQQLTDHLLPSLPYILTECDDPLPLFGLKLLAAIAERDGSVLVSQQGSDGSRQTPYGGGQPQQHQSLKMIIAAFYDLSRPNRLNRHTLNLIRILISQRAFSLSELKDLKILQNTNTIIYSMLENQQEQSLEIMLDVLHDLLTHLNDLVKHSEESIVFHVDEIFNNFEPCIHLLNTQFDMSLVEKASQCLIQILQLFAQSKLKQRDIFFTEAHFPHLLSALKHSSHRPLIQKRILKCIYWALIQNEYTIDLAQVDAHVVEGIEAWVKEVGQAGGQGQNRDKGIVQTSREVWKLMRQMMGTQTTGSGAQSSAGISQRSGQGSAQAYSQYSQYSQYGQR